jgi:DNA-binding PadR family transcriptional regulator
VAVRRRKYFRLTELEQAEFQKAMFGREDRRQQAFDFALLSLCQLKPQ